MVVVVEEEPSRIPAEETPLNDCGTTPGNLNLGRERPGLELVRYTIPVPVLGIGFENPEGVVGVVGAVEGLNRIGPPPEPT